MIWHNWREFFAMGGYAWYVWGSVGLTFAVIAGELLALRWCRKTILAELALARIVRKKNAGAGT